MLLIVILSTIFFVKFLSVKNYMLEVLLWFVFVSKIYHFYFLIPEYRHRYAILSFTGIHFYIFFSRRFLTDERRSSEYTIEYSMHEITQHTLENWKCFIQISSCFRRQRYIYLNLVCLSFWLSNFYSISQFFFKLIYFNKSLIFWLCRF